MDGKVCYLLERSAPVTFGIETKAIMGRFRAFVFNSASTTHPVLIQYEYLYCVEFSVPRTHVQFICRPTKLLKSDPILVFGLLCRHP